ncbi:MAG: agmatinase family protein [Bacteriovoracaceae bacterium]|nr:agmatinase family protein [Bacteriovoracaceae bacterium]
MTFDPNAKSYSPDHIYGLPFTEKKSQVIFIPVPWDATTSYKAGASHGPHAILKASQQMDLFHASFGKFYSAGLFMQPLDKKIKNLNKKTRELAQEIMQETEENLSSKKVLKQILEVNKSCAELTAWVYAKCVEAFKNKKTPIIVGGDHATPLGAIRAYAEKFSDLTILHFDAHSDTRKSYMGFTESHASIMYNVMTSIPQVKKLVQVGIRDFCEEEYLFTEKHPKIKVFYDRDLKRAEHMGTPWIDSCEKIIKELSHNVYISFDIDGLDPRFCPNTGTPVAGGQDFSQIITLLAMLKDSGKKLVGFDVVEVAPAKHDDWDANVGMRLMYELTGVHLVTTGKYNSK